jgi:hypothetical protein
MSDDLVEPGFAPADPTDDRKRGDWLSHYSKDAQWHIRIESIYLAIHLFGVLGFVFAMAFFGANVLPASAQSTDVPQIDWRQLLHAWLGGVLGGTLYAIKWHYHVVAKQLWHLDRRLWRLFTPHLSGALSFAFVILAASGLLVIVDKKTIASVWVCFAISFLVGYFSDSATAKLSEVAATLFGTTKRPDSHTDSDEPRNA